jgi:multimeric flavodoxin WrbA
LKVLGIMGSPRIKGNTELLLDEALKGAQSQGAETEKIVVDKLRISPCREYYGCLKDGNCVIRDEMDNIYPKLISSDAIIIASPIFFYAVSAQLKALIDRCQALWARKYVLKRDIPPKAGAFIAVGATKGKRLFEGPRLTVGYFFKSINAEYVDELLIRGVDKKGEIKEHPTALKDALELGKRLVMPSAGKGN